MHQGEESNEDLKNILLRMWAHNGLVTNVCTWRIMKEKITKETHLYLSHYNTIYWWKSNIKYFLILYKF